MKKYFINILLGFDQFANTILAGDPDETISGRLGRIKVKHGGTIPWYRPFSKITDWGLNKIDPGHSIDAIEPDEGFNGVCDKRDS